LPLPLEKRVDEVCDHFEKAWKDRQGPRIEDYLAGVPEPGRVPLFRELLALEIELRCNGSERPTPEEYHRRFPEHIELIDVAFANSPGDADSGPPGSSEGATIPHAPPTDSSAVDPGAPPPLGSSLVSDHVGRYEVVCWLGGGTYGDVYLAHDGVMDRQVAVKVPSARLLATERAREEFLREARSVARLQHEGIVRAHDFGEADGRCYIVYEYVDGESLAERIKPERIAADPLPPEEATRIVAQVAEALHYAHLQGMFHRDIKPANILLDPMGKPKLTDFGLAVREEDLAGQRGILAGTLPYMSPEQVRREAHHIDGRTDIYSLGVVLYELLCGRRPFEAKTEDELEDQILHREARPLRQIKDSILAELERICVKALSKRINDRYTTGNDMAADLRQLVEMGKPESTTTLPKKSDVAPRGFETLSTDLERQVDEVCQRFEAAWKKRPRMGQRPLIEDYLNAIPEQGRSALLMELLALEIASRHRCGETPTLREYHGRFPGLDFEISKDVIRDIIGETTPIENDQSAQRDKASTGTEPGWNPISRVCPNAVLLDHSTLISVARLLENTSSKRRRDRSDGRYYSYIYDCSTMIDVAALGTFVEAVVAHEKIYYIKAPGQKYRWEPDLRSRSASLAGILEPIEVDAKLFRSVNEQSAREIRNWQGKGGLQGFGDALLRMLGGVFDPRIFDPSPWADVARSLRDAEESDWFAEFVGEAQSLFLRLFTPMKDYHHFRGNDDSFESFVRLLFTLCYRASMYKWLAISLGLPYSPYVVRTPMVLNSLLTTPSSAPVETAKMVAKYVERFRDHAIKPIEEVMGTKLHTFTFPVFLPYLAAKCSGGRDILEACVEMRSNTTAKAFREWVGSMNARISEQGLAASHKLLREMEEWSRSTREQLGIRGRAVICTVSPLNESLVVSAETAEGSDQSGKQPRGSWWRRWWYGAASKRKDHAGKQHLFFLREVADSVLAVDDASVWKKFGLAGRGCENADFHRLSRGPWV
jgi:serine/threonine protein kinase